MEVSEYRNMYNQESNFWWYTVLHHLIISVIKQNKNSIHSIFDAGCGTGRLLELLKDFGKVSGVDMSDEAIKFCHKRGLKNVEKNNLNDWDPKIERYNAITCIDVLYHIGIKDDKQVLQKFYNVLKHDGLLILNLPAFKILERGHDKIVHTKRRYKRKDLISKLNEIGFEIKIASYRLPHAFIILLIKKVVERSKKMKPKSDVNNGTLVGNWLGNFLGRIENYFILNIGSIPFGSSIFIVASKKKSV